MEAAGSSAEADRCRVPILISVNAVMTYVACPMRFLFEFVYKIEMEKKLSDQDLWAEALCEMYTWIHRRLAEGHVTWGSILDRWEDSWLDSKRGVSPMNLEVLHGRGARHLLEIFNDLSEHMMVLGVEYPTIMVFGNFKVSMSIPVIRVVHPPKAVSPVVQLVIFDRESTPNGFEQCRRLDYALAKYLLPVQLRKEWNEDLAKLRLLVYQPQVPRLVEAQSDTEAGVAAKNWILWVLQGIEEGLFYPRAGDSCRSCPYRLVCNAKYASTNSLRRTSSIPRKILARLKHHASDRHVASEAGPVEADGAGGVG